MKSTEILTGANLKLIIALTPYRIFLNAEKQQRINNDTNR